MPAFIKVCPICNEQFYTKRLSQNFDKKKCANRARSFSPKLLKALLDKAHLALQVIDEVPKAVREYIEQQMKRNIVDGVDIKKLPLELQLREMLKAAGTSTNDQHLIIEEIMKLKRQRELDSFDAKFLSKDGTRVIGCGTGDMFDPELAKIDPKTHKPVAIKGKNFELTVVEDNKPETVDNSEGFRPLRRIEEQPVIEQPKTGIRKIGGGNK